MLSSRVTSIPGFLGRKSELVWLLNLFEEATGGAPEAKPGGPRMALVLAESGYGKSRLVQALYQALSTDQTWDPPEINYWPDSFREIEGQLRVNPDMVGHNPMGPPRFLWLGMRWHPSNVRNVEERMCQLPEARSALQAHVETARAREGVWRSMLRKSGAVLARQAADEVVGQLVDTFLPFGGLIRKAVDSVREISRHHGELGLNVSERSDAKAIDAGEEMLDNLREVFRGPVSLPVVLWLDDAQWIDPLTLGFLRQLWVEGCRKGWPLLVVITHWEREWRELLLTDESEQEKSLAWYEGKNGVSARMLVAAEGDALAGYLLAQLPGLTEAQRSLVLAKAGGNFLSMVENVGYLKKTRLNFVDKDLAKALTPAGESKVKTWSDDRRRRVEQRFEELQEEVKHLLGWGSKLGFRFLREVVSDFAKTQGVELGGTRLLQECVNPLAILGGDQNQLMREFRDRAFFDVARQYFADYGDAWEVGLNEALCGRLNAWLDATFDGDGEIRLDVPDGLMVLDSAERRDVLSMALSAYANSDDEAPKVEYQLLRARILLLQTDAVDNLWDRVREAGVELVQVDWLAISTNVIGPQVRIDFMDHLITAGAFSAARRVAESLVVIRRTNHHEIPSLANLRDVSVSLNRLGDIEVEEGNLVVARALFAESLEIARTLQVQFGTLESLRDVSVSLNKLGNIEVAEGNLAGARGLFAERLEITRTLQVQLGTPESLCDVSLSLNKLGCIEEAEGNLVIARGLFAEGLEIDRTLQVQLGTPASLRSVAVSLGKLGDIEVADGNLAVARGLFAEGLEIAHTLQVQLGTPKSVGDVSVSLVKLGDIEVADGNLAVARKLIAEGLEIARMLQVQLGTPASLHDVMVSLQRLSVIEEAEGNLAVARGLFSECLEITRTLQVQLGTPESLRNVSVSLSRLGDIEVAEGNLAVARRLFAEGLEIRRMLQVRLGTPESLRDVSVSLNSLGDIEVSEGNFAVARRLFAEGLEIRRMLQVQLGTPGSLRDVSLSLNNLGDIEVAEGNLAGARKLFAEGLEIARMLQVQLGTPASLRDVSLSLDRLGDIEVADGNLAVARGLFAEGLEIDRMLQVQLGTPGSLRDLVFSYYKIASVSLSDEQIDWAKKALEVAKELASNFPDYPRQVFEFIKKYWLKINKQKTYMNKNRFKINKPKFNSE